MNAISFLLALLLSFTPDPHAGACLVISANGTASLGLVTIPTDDEPLTGGGAVPFEIMIGPFLGEMSSVVHSSLIDEEGVQHMRLTHYVVTGQSDAFWTEDQASCTPLPEDPRVCNVLTKMEVVRGVGAFAGASGKITNQGTITGTDATPDSGFYGTLEYSIAGEVCGLGL
jgi:hypothetical protein